MKCNRKGFTLAELLVTIVILGIITGLSIPIIRGLQASQSEKRYSIYVDSVNSAAKLYTDSYSEDLFGNYNTGCTYIRYKDMYKYHLLKDINVSGISCNTNYTYVKVTKFHDQYYYKPYIGCGAKTGSAVKAEIFKPTKPSASSICNSNSNNAIVVSTSPEKSESIINQKVSPIIKLISETGVKNSPPVLDYGYSRDNSTNVINGSWTRLNFDIPKAQVQEKMIKSGDTQVFRAKGAAVTPNESGEFYLVIRVGRLENLENRPWKKISTTADNYIITGPYKVDVDAPTITNLKVTSSTSEYNNKKVKVTFDTNDNYTEKGDLKICISEKECSDSDYTESYSASGYDFTFSGNYNGSTKKIYIGVKDKAGNIGKLASDNYVLYKECTATKLKGDWTNVGTCTKKCGGGTVTQESSIIDTYLNTTCPGKSTRTNACNTMSCCSQTTNTYGSWSGWSGCSKKCGGGTQTRTRTVTKKSVYDGSACGTTTEKGSQSCNTMSCCSKTTTKCGSYGSWSSCSKSCGGGTRKRTRTCTKYSDYDGSKCSSSRQTDTGSCNTRDCCSSTTKKKRSVSGYYGCTRIGGGAQARRCRCKRRITYRLISNYNGQSCGTTTSVETVVVSGHACS